LRNLRNSLKLGGKQQVFLYMPNNLLENSKKVEKWEFCGQKKLVFIDMPKMIRKRESMRT